MLNIKCNTIIIFIIYYYIIIYFYIIISFDCQLKVVESKKLQIIWYKYLIMKYKGISKLNSIH